jgi:L-ascorbate metabolism protein UlaG (beta-lactamase superfamily)
VILHPGLQSAIAASNQHLRASNPFVTYLKRAQKDDRKFLNPVPTAVGGFSMIFKVLPLYLSNREETEPKTPIGPFHTDTSIYRTPPASGLRVTWFGHSSLLVEIDGLRVLIDPIWEKRAAPLQSFGPKRFFAPTLRLEDLPRIDVILISHDHYDHLGRHTVEALSELSSTANARWVTSLGVGKRLRKFGVNEHRISELDWTQSTITGGADLGSELKITALPARHFSGRGLTDRFASLWSSFVIEGPQHRIYFGADSGLWDGFKEIGETYGPFDLTMLEIGAYNPLWKQIHMGPDGAADAHKALGGPERAGLLMPIHWGLFNLALHAWRSPIETLTQRAQSENIPLWSPVPGLPTEIEKGKVLLDPWWTSK